MFEVGFTELLLIFALALVVLGPERLPRVASQVGRWLGRARAMARQFREQLEEEANLDPTSSPRSSRRSASAGRPTTPDVKPADTASSSGEPPANFVPGEDDFRHNETAEPKGPDERGT
ncbi:MAG: Sec-independent protein translocase protein TatB [Steroidobacteraceae bacterium]